MTRPLRVFTSRYSNPFLVESGLEPVGITRYPPRFRLAYELKANLYDLAPTLEMLQIATEENGRDRFSIKFWARLDRIGVDQILGQLRAMQGDGDGVVLLCYEDVRILDQWCHRQLVSHWLHAHARLLAPELHDPSEKARRKPTRGRRGQAQ